AHLFTLYLYRLPPVPISTHFPYTTLFRSWAPGATCPWASASDAAPPRTFLAPTPPAARSATRIAQRAVRFLQVEVGLQAQPEARSEEHTSELQSRFDLVCRLQLEQK